jgi:hypothetical protein
VTLDKSTTHALPLTRPDDARHIALSELANAVREPADLDQDRPWDFGNLRVWWMVTDSIGD